MATKKLKTMDFIKTLQELDRGFFTVADFQKITGLSKNSLKVTLNRLVKQGILTRLKRGIYQLSLSVVDVKKIANQLYYPSYLSFESALSNYSLLSQIPFTQTFATTRKSKKMTIWDTEVEFTQIKKDLFFGYTFDKGIYIAEPEKALLDQLYLISRGKRTLNIKELDLRKINKEKFDQYAKRFPNYIYSLANQVKKYLG
ncbi:type IV toxin-antitoxin system AbiEi family antitoxin domain-containing protein [Patescibacteria group bacterium]|nr:type IV toxin-antitoxin system AbiEi family antitoxin domain-containing protein [Patescibacteria group bacterium]